MKNSFCAMISNDNMYVENNEAWFISRDTSELYKWDVLTEKCQYIADILENNVSAYRRNPTAVKYQERIICLPDKGECIWIYDLMQNTLKKVMVDNLSNTRLGIFFILAIDTTMWAVSGGLKSFLEIDMKNEQIKNYYKLTDNASELFACEFTKVGNNIYFFSQTKSMLCEFNIISKEMIEYEPPKLGKVINTICYDGEFFWFSDYDGCIYRWNKNKNETDYCVAPPHDLEIVRNGYRALFYKSVCVGKYICFLPWNSNEVVCNGILFLNRNNLQMKTIKLYDSGNENGIYTLEYVKDDRYIGIHYENNSYISEIDTETFEIKERRMKFTVDNYTKILKTRVKQDDILAEKNSIDLPAFLNL